MLAGGQVEAAHDVVGVEDGGGLAVHGGAPVGAVFVIEKEDGGGGDVGVELDAGGFVVGVDGDGAGVGGGVGAGGGRSGEGLVHDDGLGGVKGGVGELREGGVAVGLTCQWE